MLVAGITAVCYVCETNPDMTTPAAHPRDPLHGITLEKILNVLVQRHGWEEMGRCIPIRCFQFDPSVKSSLTFLRKTPWARQKVEAVVRRGASAGGKMIAGGALKSSPGL